MTETKKPVPNLMKALLKSLESHPAVMAETKNTTETMPLCQCGHTWALHIIPGGVDNIDIYPNERHCVDCACRRYAPTPEDRT